MMIPWSNKTMKEFMTSQGTLAFVPSFSSCARFKKSGTPRQAVIAAQLTISDNIYIQHYSPNIIVDLLQRFSHNKS